MMKDLPRVAKFYEVPLHLVKDFLGTVIEKGSLKAMRFVTAVDMAEPQFLEPVSRELWMRIWSRVSMVVLFLCPLLRKERHAASRCIGVFENAVKIALRSHSPGLMDSVPL
nr:glutathione S-transferase kappa 1-like [Zootoca vivipara]